MPVTYSPALKPQEIGSKVLSDCYPELNRPEVHVEYLFSQKKDKDGIPEIPTRKGKEVWGDVKLVSGLSAYLANEVTGGGEEEPRPFFVVLINQQAWNYRLKEDSQKEAFIDSLLARCDYDSEKNKLSTREFDVREYHEVMKRRGAWHPELEKFIQVAKQMPLPNVVMPKKARTKRAKAAAATAG